jgi:HEAT repeat protein
MPQEGVEALIAALEHPERVETIAGHDHGLRHDITKRLADVGDRRAAEILRRFTDDPEIGEAATEAVRAIEGRSA